ncbi:serine hydrolase [Arenicella chitinivorans]|nr:serine hydrolase [Arenicella chitinivorans]
MKFTIVLLLLATPGLVKATDQDLHQQLEHMDALLFENAFNQCDLDVLERITHTDFEFYHDQGGEQDRAEFFAAIRKNICGNPDAKPIRKLAPGTLTVFPMYDDGELYAALQSGEHDFYIRAADQSMVKTGTARFTSLWALHNTQWLLKRVLSYDHQPSTIVYPSQAVERDMDAGFRPALFDTERRISALLKQHHIPSIGMGVIEGGRLQQLRMFAAEQAPPLDAIYKVASLTKPIAALVTLKLVNEGRWDLDSPLSRYFVDPDVAKSAELRSLTTRHVLSHQSGFPNWRYLSPNNTLRFEFKPGTRYQYSGEGFEYLRKAIEAKLGQPFEDVAQQTLFEPLAMLDTHFYWHDQVDARRFQPGHDADGKKLPVARHTRANAAANLLTTVEDYAKFMIYLSAGAELDPSLFAEMVRPHVDVSQASTFALGWQRFDIASTDSQPSEYVLQHTGGDPGVKTIAVLMPQSQRGLVLLSNSENATKLWGKIISEHYGTLGISLTNANFQ